MNKAIIKAFIICVSLMTMCHTFEDGDIIYAKKKCTHSDIVIRAGRLFEVVSPVDAFFKDTKNFSKVVRGHILKVKENRRSLNVYNADGVKEDSRAFEKGWRFRICDFVKNQELVGMSMLGHDKERIFLKVCDVADHFKKDNEKPPVAPQPQSSPMDAFGAPLTPTKSSVNSPPASPPLDQPPARSQSGDAPTKSSADSLSVSAQAGNPHSPPTESLVDSSPASKPLPQPPARSQSGDAPPLELLHSSPTKPSVDSSSESNPLRRPSGDAPAGKPENKSSVGSSPPLQPLRRPSGDAHADDASSMNQAVDVAPSDTSSAASLSLTFVIGFAIAIVMAMN